VKFLMKNGRRYDVSTLDEMWPRQRKLDRQWWMPVVSDQGKNQ